MLVDFLLVQMKRMVEIYIKLAELETKKEVEVYPALYACLLLCIAISFYFFELRVEGEYVLHKTKKSRMWLWGNLLRWAIELDYILIISEGNFKWCMTTGYQQKDSLAKGNSQRSTA